jgi:ABC-2 type transport system ATP-binding protein
MMIQVRDLTKYFGPVLAVDHISFEVDRGEIVGFLGPNGAGKTTTLRILTSYLPATSGSARVAGYDVLLQSLEVRQHIGYLPENVPLYGEMRVEEYLNYRAKLKGVNRKERPQRLDYCLERCRLRQVRRRLVGTLSRGYRQRVGLADALLHDPPILILDEPTAGLDPVQIRETLALIRDLGTDHTILLSTHILSEVEAVCDRVILIYAGRIALSSSLEELEQARAVLVEVRAPSEQAREVLRQVPGVASVLPAGPVEDGISRFEVQVQGEQDVREAISQALMQRGWPLRRLEQKRRRLEEAFFEVLRTRDPLHTTAPAAAGPAETAIQDLSRTAGTTPGS